MKYNPPTVTLPLHWTEEAYRIKELLENHSHGNIDAWCEALGFILCRNSFIVRRPLPAVIHGDTIYIREDLMRTKEIYAIAHEYCHWKFHPECVGFLDLNEYASGKLEAQAIEFGKCVAWEE